MLPSQLVPVAVLPIAQLSVTMRHGVCHACRDLARKPDAAKAAGEAAGAIHRWLGPNASATCKPYSTLHTSAVSALQQLAVDNAPLTAQQQQHLHSINTPLQCSCDGVCSDVAAFLRDGRKPSFSTMLRPYYRDHVAEKLADAGLSEVVSVSEMTWGWVGMPANTMRAAAQKVTFTKKDTSQVRRYAGQQVACGPSVISLRWCLQGSGGGAQ